VIEASCQKSVAVVWQQLLDDAQQPRQLSSSRQEAVGAGSSTCESYFITLPPLLLLLLLVIVHQLPVPSHQRQQIIKLSIIKSQKALPSTTQNKQQIEPQLHQGNKGTRRHSGVQCCRARAAPVNLSTCQPVNLPGSVLLGEPS
jgi:hypothetical protein